MNRERIEELAALHALDLLEGEDVVLFENELRTNPEAREIFAHYKDTSELLPLSIEQFDPPAGLEDRIFAALPDQPSKGPARPEPVVEFAKPSVNWLPWALAASLALACLFIAADNFKQREKIANIPPPSTVDSLYVAVLGSLIENSPDATAVAVWDANRQEGVLTASNLPAISEEEDYQLWIIVPENPAPISAGVFNVADDGTARYAFRPESGSPTEGVFAISREPRGGSPQPQGPVVLASSGS